MDSIDDALAIADQEWRATGLRPRDRAALAADLRLDLEAAAADGITPDQLFGADPRDFARRLADEAGVPRVPHEYPRLVLTALTGAVVGAIVAYFVVASVHSALVAAFDLSRTIHVPGLLAVSVHFGSGILILIGGAVAAVRIHMRGVPRIGRTAVAMGVLLPAAAIVITPVTVGFASMTGYDTSAPVIAVEVAMVVAAFASATVLARWWALHNWTVDTVSAA